MYYGYKNIWIILRIIFILAFALADIRKLYTGNPWKKYYAG